TIILPGGGVFLGAALWGLGLSVVQPLTVTAARVVGGTEAPRTVATVTTMAWSATPDRWRGRGIGELAQR
ncbi:MAG TPA: hypothetical protein VFP34_13560, partial [Microlunatus sp.]|nr:hypothetical protein [Microlunatus sp.]